MRIFNRPALMKAHALLAAFILPAAVMFFVTGALYTWGIKGDYDTSTYELYLKKPVQGELTELVDLAKEELKKQGLQIPSGQAKIKRIGSAFKLEWTGSDMDIVIEPTSQLLIAKLEIKKTNWHRQFVQLHKAKGGPLFKIYAAAFSVALLLLLATGFIMAWQMPNLRKLTMISSSLGLVLFVVMVISS